MQRRISQLVPRALAAYAAAAASAARAQYRYTGNKAAGKKIANRENESWLEAELDENVNTPEERYAHEKEIRRLRAMVDKIDANHSADVERIKKEQDADVKRLKAEMVQLEKRIKEAEARK